MGRTQAWALVVAIGILGIGAAPTTAAAAIHIDTLNPVVGDASYRWHFGQAPSPESDETVRIATHLRYAEALLRATPTPLLSPAQRAARTRSLNQLRAYALRGVFPRNDDHPDARRPTFIDDGGRICAVGYLVEQQLGRPAADAIAAGEKYAFVAELRSPLVAAFAPLSGLSARELAIIQPTYRHASTRAPDIAFATLDRLGSASHLALSVAMPRGDDGTGVRGDLFAAYLPLDFGTALRGRWQLGGYGALAYGGEDSTGDAGLGNAELGAALVRETRRGRVIFRAGGIVPSATGEHRRDAAPGDAVAHRLADAILAGPPATGVRLSVSPVWVDLFSNRGCGMSEYCTLRLDVGLDVRAVRGRAADVSGRLGLGFALNYQWLEATVEGAVVSLPTADDSVTAHGEVAGTLRFPRARVRPGIVLAAPLGPNRLGWVLGVDLQIVGGPASHDRSYWHDNGTHEW